MSFELASGAEGRWTGQPGAQSGRLRERRTAADTAGTWSASIEWLVRRVAPRFSARSLLEVRYRLKSWRRLELCVEDTRAAIAAAREQGAEKIALLGFSMGGAVAIQAAADPAVSTVIGLAPWLYPELDVSPLDGRRFAIVHGALDRGLPGVPGVAPDLSRHGYERALERGVDAVRTTMPGALHPIALRAPWGARCRWHGRGAGQSSSARSSSASAPRASTGSAAPARGFARAPALPGRDRRAAPPVPCILAANHESMLDPPLLSFVAEQPLRFLAKEELWRPARWRG